MTQFLSSDAFSFAILPLFIFLIRVVDVSMGTIRIIFISKDIRSLSAIFGFFEVLIWLFAISRVINNINSPVYYIAYAAGFSMGTFVGVTIERAFLYGNRIIQLITKKDAAALVEKLRKAGYGVTSISGEGATGPVKLIFTVVKKNKVKDVIELIRRFNSKAFYTVEDAKFVQDRYDDAVDSEQKKLMSLGLLFQKRK
ncbi:MAG: DUF2179 domain-containing protein [Candidatus Omnitrophica bacterium]|nr:DUF2179 domain-containing protein [Candidatus Omnitrophota bacterium]